MEETGHHETPLRPFFVLWTGQALSLIGSMAVQFALIWWLTARTGSAAVLAVAAFLGLAPAIVLGPVAGALIDRWSRRRVMIVADGLVAAASLILAVVFVTGTATTAHVLALLFARAIGGTFHGPAMMASTTLMVPKRHLTRIQGLNQTLQGGQMIVSAPLGAVLIATLPMAGVMLVDVATALLAIVPLFFIHVPQPERVDADPRSGLASTWRDVTAGVRYLRERNGHLAILAMGAVINLFLVPAFSLLPLLVVEQDGGAGRLGVMHSVFGVGTIAGGLLLGIWGGFRRRIHTTFLGLILLGSSVFVVGGAQAGLVALIGMAALGVTVPLVNGPIQAVLQATVAPEIQARVFTLYGSVCSMMTPIGLALAAPVADLLGVRIWYAAGGVACLMMGSLGFVVPSIARIEEVTTGSPDVAAPVMGPERSASDRRTA